VVSDVPEQPPQALGPAHVSVGDDEHSFADTGATGRTCELVGSRQRVPSARPRLRREVDIDVEKARTRDVTGEVELAGARGIPELPAAVDELVTQRYQLPSGDGGSGTDAGWMT
jgi:hypothetical protein